MSKKSGGSNPKMVITMAATGGVFVLRKVEAAVWKKITGKAPPTDLTDPKVTLTEALVWAVITGIVAEAVRFAIVRTSMRRMPAAEGDSAAESN